MNVGRTLGVLVRFPVVVVVRVEGGDFMSSQGIDINWILSYSVTQSRDGKLKIDRR
jgi:hypothetical protein